MPKPRRLFRLFAAAVAVAVTAVLAGTVLASGAAAASDCPVYSTVQPFLQWNDAGYYFTGPGGAFESSLTGWTASGAKIVSGNETFYVHGSTDGHSLSLPKSSTVTSPSICVGADTPDLRLFVRNTGSATATLTVKMTYTNKNGKASTVTVGTLTGGSSWSLSPAVYFLQNIQPLVDAYGQTWVTFTFASNGTFTIDDFYVDPHKAH